MTYSNTKDIKKFLNTQITKISKHLIDSKENDELTV